VLIIVAGIPLYLIFARRLLPVSKP